uniref:Uncharacterized protein n=1 Tax=candidate division CPR3 bacterium TaxID=2268181 RepID=A0A7C4R2P4_UNCC3
MPPEKILISWDVTKEKKDSNSIVAIVIAFLVIILAITYFIFEKKYLNAFVFLLLALSLVWYLVSAPKNFRIVLMEKGFTINNQRYSFENFKSFWVSKKTGVFYFQPKGRVGSIVSFPSGSIDPEKIKNHLPEEILEEEDRGDDLTNRINSIFKI